MTLAVCVVAIATAQTFGEMGMPKKPTPAPIDKDIPFIKCGVCKRAMEEAYARTRDLVTEDKPAPIKKRRLEASSSAGDLEGKVEDMLQEICDPEKSMGEWISELDVVKSGQELTLVHKGPGHCRRECRTIAKVCETLMDKLADDDLQSVLTTAVRDASVTRAADVQKLAKSTVCTKMAGVCKKGKTPKWPEGKVRKNEEFKPKDLEQAKKDQDLAKMLESMKDVPGAGSMSFMRPGDLDLDDADESLKDEV